MRTDSGSSISHIQTWLLQLHSDQPTRHHTSSIHHYPPQCCTTRQKLEAKRSHHPSSSATPLASHQSANFIQNLCPHVQHPFWVIPALHVILGHTVHKCWIEIESPLVCQRRLLNPAHVQLIRSTSVAVAGPSEWNKLPVSLRHAPSIGSFKTKLKTHLFQIYYG